MEYRRRASADAPAGFNDMGTYLFDTHSAR
jgi:hypothetical protein